MGRWRPQFRLRTLLALLTACAALVWVYAIGWPWWALHREQADFEESLKQLKAGTTQDAGSNLVRYKTCFTRMMATGSTPAGEAVVFSVYSWNNACYCICYVLASRPSGNISWPSNPSHRGLPAAYLHRPTTSRRTSPAAIRRRTMFGILRRRCLERAKTIRANRRC